MKLPHFEIETHIAVVYAIFGGLWIILSDTLLASITRHEEFFTTVGVFQCALWEGFLSVNPIMARIFGYDSPEEMLSSIASIEKQYYVDPADRHEFQRLLLEQGEVREFITENRRKDGGHIWVQENARAKRMGRGTSCATKVSSPTSLSASRPKMNCAALKTRSRRPTSTSWSPWSVKNYWRVRTA